MLREVVITVATGATTAVCYVLGVEVLQPPHQRAQVRAGHDQGRRCGDVDPVACVVLCLKKKVLISSTVHVLHEIMIISKEVS